MAALPVFLVHYDAPEWVQSSAASILASDVDVDLTVVSNSGPVTIPGARVIVTGKNLGYAGGANVALQEWLQSEEEFCVIGSHDLHLEPDALRQVREAMEANLSLGLAAPQMPDGAVGRSEDGVTWLSGQAIMYRRKCIEQVGGFDERFRSYGEDVDLSLRVRSAGWALAVIEGARGHGLGSAVGSRSALRRAWSKSLALHYKHSGWAAVPKALVVHFKSALFDAGRAMGPGVNRRQHLIRAIDRLAVTPVSVVELVRFASSKPASELLVERH